MAVPAQRPRPFIATAPAGPGERQIALVAIALMAAGFLAAVQFLRLPLARIEAFVPAYESALALNDLMTAVLLFGQFAMLQRRSLLVLASAYLFTSSTAVLHMLTFPGAFTPGGLLGGGPQTTPLLYIFWHGGFPLAIIAYAWLARSEGPALRRAGLAIAAAIATVAVVVAGLTVIAVYAAGLVPAPLNGDHYTRAMVSVVYAILALPVVGLAALWMKPRRSLLDLWLSVVLCAWFFDVALSAAFNSGRYDLGFYVGRLYGLLAGSFVLVMLIAEMTMLYARSAQIFEAERAERERRLRQAEAELTHVSRVSELGTMVSGLAHEVNQPLSAATTYATVGQRFLDAGEIDKARSAFEKLAAQIARTVAITQRIRQFGKKREAERRFEDLAGVVEEAVALAVAGPGGKTVRIATRLPPAAPVPLDRIQIQQVLLNLIRNAIEAMAGSARREIVISAAPADGNKVEITVADTGPGLAPEVRERLFQPFVTTKGDGMGIGLSICRSIIESHGGRMWIADNPGGGTVFHFTLPVRLSESEAAGVSRAKAG
jgi:signal transduction histidine kinase